jgi:hypothetical protein
MATSGPVGMFAPFISIGKIRIWFATIAASRLKALMVTAMADDTVADWLAFITLTLFIATMAFGISAICNIS